MNFQKTFDIEKAKVNRIPIFFKARGYKLEISLENNYRFARGSSWTATLIRDVKNLPTRVEVILTEKEVNMHQVLILVDIDTLGRVVPNHMQETIKAELESLQAFCKNIP